MPGDAAGELIAAGTGAGRALRHFAEDVHAMLPEPRLAARTIAPEALLDPPVPRSANQRAGGGGKKQ